MTCARSSPTPRNATSPSYRKSKCPDTAKPPSRRTPNFPAPAAHSTSARVGGVHNEVYCAGNEQTFALLEDVLSEVVELFPSEFIHIGGDECPKERWKACPKCQARIATEGPERRTRVAELLHSADREIPGKQGQTTGWLGRDSRRRAAAERDGAVVAGNERGDRPPRPPGTTSSVRRPATAIWTTHRSGCPASRPGWASSICIRAMRSSRHRRS